jgi:hypothetical protein
MYKLKLMKNQIFSILLIGLVAILFACSKAADPTGSSTNNDGISSNSLIDLGVPQNFSVKVIDDGLEFSWSASTGPVSGYIVYYGKISSGNFSSAIDVGKVTKYKVYGLENDETYQFCVRAYDKDDIRSNFSSTITETFTDILGPAAPTAFTLREEKNEHTQTYYFEISWKNPTNKDFSGIALVRRDDGRFPQGPTDGEVVYREDEESVLETFVDLGIQIGQQYWYKIFAFDKVNNYSQDINGVTGLHPSIYIRD